MFHLRWRAMFLHCRPQYDLFNMVKWTLGLKSFNMILEFWPCVGDLCLHILMSEWFILQTLGIEPVNSLSQKSGHTCSGSNLILGGNFDCQLVPLKPCIVCRSLRMFLWASESNLQRIRQQQSSMTGQNSLCLTRSKILSWGQALLCFLIPNKSFRAIIKQNS